MNKEKDHNIKELKKEIVIERLRQAPSTIKVSFGNTPDGRFMDRDDLIKNVREETEIGRKIIDIHLTFLRAFKKDLSINQ